MLLHSRIFNDNEVKLVLERFLDHIDYTKYFSVEKYFESILIQKCRDRGIIYSKHEDSLDPIFLQNENVLAICGSLPDIKFPLEDKITQHILPSNVF